MNTGDISITMETLRKRRFTVAGWSLTLGGRDHKTATTTAFVNKKPKWKEKTENDKHDVCACIWSKQIARLMCICVSVCVYWHARVCEQTDISHTGFPSNGSRMICVLWDTSEISAMALSRTPICDRWMRWTREKNKSMNEQIYLLCSDRHTYKLPT